MIIKNHTFQKRGVFPLISELKKIKFQIFNTHELKDEVITSNSHRLETIKLVNIQKRLLKSSLFAFFKTYSLYRMVRIIILSHIRYCIFPVTSHIMHHIIIEKIERKINFPENVRTQAHNLISSQLIVIRDFK